MGILEPAHIPEERTLETRLIRLEDMVKGLIHHVTTVDKEILFLKQYVDDLQKQIDKLQDVHNEFKWDVINVIEKGGTTV